MSSLPRCALALTDEALGAWLSHSLAATEQERVGAHIGDCPHCQHVVAQMRQVDILVSRQIVPDVHAQLWRGVQMQIATNKTERKPMQPRYIAGTATVAALVLFAFIGGAIILPHLHKGASVTVDAPLHVTAAQGWVQSPDLAFAKSVAFARSNPLIGYACGNVDTTATQSLPIKISVTRDGGRVWKALMAVPSSAPEFGCSFSIDPQNAQDVVLLTQNSLVDDNGEQIEGSVPTLRSMDGGQHWTPLLLPQDAPDRSSFRVVAWVGSALVVMNTHRIAASVSGEPLAWIDSAIDIHPKEIFQNGFALGNTFYLLLYDTTPQQSITDPFGYIDQYLKTSDLGKTWVRARWPQEVDTYSLVAGADGKTLYSDNSGAGISSSTDGGQTWRVLAPLPPKPYIVDGSGFSFLPVAPDGTIYLRTALGRTAQTISLYKLAPGATTWTYVASEAATDVISPITISTDPQGHPNALWMAHLNKYYAGNPPSLYITPLPGILYHAP